ALGDLLHGGAQHAVGIDGVDDAGGDHPVHVRHGREVELPHQVILQALRGAVAGIEVPVVVARRAAARGGALVDVVPLGIHGQVVGNGFVPVALARAHFPVGRGEPHAGTHVGAEQVHLLAVVLGAVLAAAAAVAIDAVRVELPLVGGHALVGEVLGV